MLLPVVAKRIPFVRIDDGSHRLKRNKRWSLVLVT